MISFEYACMATSSTLKKKAKDATVVVRNDPNPNLTPSCLLSLFSSMAEYKGIETRVGAECLIVLLVDEEEVTGKGVKRF